MSIYNLLENGNTQNYKNNLGEKIASFMGYLNVKFKRNVRVGNNPRISPEAHICPRDSKITFGNDILICREAMIQGNVTIGNNCSIQTHSLIVGYKEFGVEIGNNVRIAPFVTMISANHNFDRVDIPIYCQGVSAKKIVIEDDCWIASRVNIMAGVTIGKGSVIAAGAVITKDVEPYSVMGGVPANIIKSRI